MADKSTAPSPPPKKGKGKGKGTAPKGPVPKGGGKAPTINKASAKPLFPVKDKATSSGGNKDDPCINMTKTKSPIAKGKPLEPVSKSKGPVAGLPTYIQIEKIDQSDQADYKFFCELMRSRDICENITDAIKEIKDLLVPSHKQSREYIFNHYIKNNTASGQGDVNSMINSGRCMVLYCLQRDNVSTPANEGDIPVASSQGSTSSLAQASIQAKNMAQAFEIEGRLPLDTCRCLKHTNKWDEVIEILEKKKISGWDVRAKLKSHIASISDATRKLELDACSDHETGYNILLEIDKEMNALEEAKQNNTYQAQSSTDIPHELVLGHNSPVEGEDITS